ncbi:MAG TPA: twin transmembrane helix small protein, partial [Xanthomonadales bacterium]|nr:twin transmembrane helix small protein [Xanthomonadales bacterium]
ARYLAESTSWHCQKIGHRHSYTQVHRLSPRSLTMLKAAIVLMLIATVVSLFSGLFFLVKDDSRSNRLVIALSVRVTLAALTLGLIAWGFFSGQLVSNAPW